LPFDLGRTLPVGFGWPPPAPPPPPVLAGMFPPLACEALDSGRLPPPALTSVRPFSMSASDLLKSFQQKAASASASGADSDVRDMADNDRLMSLFPLLTGGGQYGGVTSHHGEDDTSVARVAVGWVYITWTDTRHFPLLATRAATSYRAYRLIIVISVYFAVIVTIPN